MFAPHALTLKSGEIAHVRRAEGRDAAALISHANEVGAEEIYIQTEHLDSTVEEEERWINGFDGRSSLLLVAEVGGRIVGVADFKRGRRSRTRTSPSSESRSRRGPEGKGWAGQCWRTGSAGHERRESTSCSSACSKRMIGRSLSIGALGSRKRHD